jgi:hypothetical protein
MARTAGAPEHHIDANRDAGVPTITSDEPDQSRCLPTNRNVGGPGAGLAHQKSWNPQKALNRYRFSAIIAAAQGKRAEQT